jgi:hypothetical protein
MVEKNSGVALLLSKLPNVQMDRFADKMDRYWVKKIL